MYKLKDAVRRGSALLGVVGLLAGVGASVMVPASAYADDTLNPLTQRSLTLSSSSPGWSNTDGSGNVTYASPNSGANGDQTANTFSFVQSTTGPVNAFSFQYCTTAAGTCFAPGNNGYVNYPACLTAGSGGTADCTRAANSADTSDLNIVTGSGGGAPSEISSGTYSAITSGSPDSRGNTCFTSAGTTYPTDAVANCAYTGTPATSGTDMYPGAPKMDNTEGNFVVLQNGVVSPNWTMTTVNLEDGDTSAGILNADNDTGADNMIVLQNSNGPVTVNAGDTIKVVFYANADNYITNPGAGAFFVLINDYDDTHTGGYPYGTSTPTGSGETADAGDFGPASPYIVDGGVTVANVMNQSIEIQTKVLETMDFSVGTVDPDTLSSAQLTAAGDSPTEGQCNTILPAFTTSGAQNTLLLGNEAAENSLMTTDAFATHSYFRLSSNSSGGATVYYAGVPLSNTEGNQIDAGGMSDATSVYGTEQFGIGLDILGSSGATEAPDYSVADSGTSPTIKFENGADTDGGVNTPGEASPGVSAYWTANMPSGAHNPQLTPLTPETGYGGASGGINSAIDGNTTAAFSFNPNSNTIPQPIASESSQVVNCVTGKVRYLANIAATTAAGIYTTKINYIAAPEY